MKSVVRLESGPGDILKLVLSLYTQTPTSGYANAGPATLTCGGTIHRGDLVVWLRTPIHLQVQIQQTMLLILMSNHHQSHHPKYSLVYGYITPNSSIEYKRIKRSSSAWNKSTQGWGIPKVKVFQVKRGPAVLCLSFPRSLSGV
eukprot:PhF_6_TR31543/c0_g1_i5/m.46542